MPGGGIRLKKKRAAAERYVRLTYGMMQSQAWRSLDGNARAIYVELAMLYRGTNNGLIGFSARQAARAIPVSMATAARAMIKLQDRGFIVAGSVRLLGGGSPSSNATSPVNQPLVTSRPGPPQTSFRFVPAERS
jgi:hypothetical protein